MARALWCLVPLLVNAPLLLTLLARAPPVGDLVRFFGGPVLAACPARSEVLESWMRPGLRVYVFDAASLRPAARELFGEAAWWATYEAWAAAPASFPNQTLGDPESPGAFLHAALRPALEARAPQVELVGSPEEADLVLWNVWEVALCLASGHPADSTELSKGRLRLSCPAHFALLAWLQGTPRWRRNHGRDHVLFVDNPYRWESFRDYIPQGSGPPPPFVPDARDVMRITRNATLITVEDRRALGHRGHSASVAVPYFAEAAKYQAPARRHREHLVGLAASSQMHAHSSCEVCSELPHGASELRARMFADLEAGCAEGECEVYDLTKVLGTGQRDNLTVFGSFGVNLDGIVHNAVFCPIPRGDSGCTKRLFAAILAGCIPVVVSDVLALPFASVVDYRGATLRIPEAQMMSPGFSLLAFLRSQSPQQIAAMQGRLECIKHWITYRPRGLPAAGLPARPAPPADAMDTLVASLAHLARHPEASLSVTAADYYGPDAAVVTTPVF